MSDFSKQLKALLRQDIVNLDTLSSLLEKEKATLTTRNTDRINQIAKEKSATVNSLDSRAKLKAQLIAKSDLGIKPGHVEAGLEKLGDSELLDLWHESKEKMSHCKDLNIINGNIISRSLQRTNKLMMIVRGQTQNNNLYGQKGKEQSYSSSHRIGQA